MRIPSLLAVALIATLNSFAADTALPDQARVALEKATAHMRSISTEGGYLWKYALDLSERAGEVKAHGDAGVDSVARHADDGNDFPPRLRGVLLSHCDVSQGVAASAPPAVSANFALSLAKDRLRQNTERLLAACESNFADGETGRFSDEHRCESRRRDSPHFDRDRNAAFADARHSGVKDR